MDVPPFMVPKGSKRKTGFPGLPCFVQNRAKGPKNLRLAQKGSEENCLSAGQVPGRSADWCDVGADWCGLEASGALHLYHSL